MDNLAEVGKWVVLHLLVTFDCKIFQGIQILPNSMEKFFKPKFNFRLKSVQSNTGNWKISYCYLEKVK